MKRGTVVATLLAAAFALFAGSAVAWRVQAPANPPAAQNPTMMMGGGMMGNWGQMNAHHQQMFGLMNQLMASMTAIQNEKDPAALQSKLAEHRALLEKMRTQMSQQGGMMHNFSGQIQQYCPMAGANAAPPQK